MRVALAIASLILGACANNTSSFDASYQRSRSLLQSEQYNQALSSVAEAERRAEGNPDAHVRWRLRLLKAEIWLAERRATEALGLLRDDPPQGPEWAEYRTRALLLRGTAAYFLARYSEASELLARAAKLADESGASSLSAEIQLRQA